MKISSVDSALIKSSVCKNQNQCTNKNCNLHSEPQENSVSFKEARIINPTVVKIVCAIGGAAQYLWACLLGQRENLEKRRNDYSRSRNV